jgi:phosphohistidine phosphatase
MDLYLMRHGIAVSAEEPTVTQDRERALTDKGAKRVQRAARGLGKLGLSIDAILTSPLLRARQTADIVAAELDLASRLEEFAELAPGNTVEFPLLGLKRYYDRGNLLLVGHQPLLGQLLARLISAAPDADLDINLGKSSVARVKTDGLRLDRPGKLSWLLTAKQLRLIGRR